MNEIYRKSVIRATTKITTYILFFKLNLIVKLRILWPKLT